MMVRLTKAIFDCKEELIKLVERRRDMEWSRAIGLTDDVLTPEKAAEWLEKDRQERARHVSDARVRRGPQWS